MDKVAFGGGGDKWILDIIKLLLLEHKKTFKDFYESDESTAPNILSARLKTLLKTGFFDDLIVYLLAVERGV